MTWADETMMELEAKGRENWTEADWESYIYIENARAELDYYDD